MELPPFGIARRAVEGIEVLAPSGRITLGQSVRELRQCIEQISEAGGLRVLVNMAEVPYVDSAGLGSLVSGLSLIKKGGGALVLSDVQPRVRQLLELTNLTGVVPIYDSEREAIQSFAGQLS